MPRAATRTGTHTAARRTKSPTALDLLKEDHAQVEKVFKQFERFHKNGDDDGMRRCAQAACKALTVHAQIEEEIFYPALRESADAEDALDEADVEHGHIKELVGRIEGGEPGDDRYEARVTVLSEYVQHHVKEEESTIFAKARRSGVDLVALGERLMARKRQLAGDELPAEITALTSRSRTARSRNGPRASR
jgi:hemerythrin superfamily protein